MTEFLSLTPYPEGISFVPVIAVSDIEIWPLLGRMRQHLARSPNLDVSSFLEYLFCR